MHILFICINPILAIYIIVIMHIALINSINPVIAIIFIIFKELGIYLKLIYR